MPEEQPLGEEYITAFTPSEALTGAPRKRHFEQWHKPRKQFIRRFQWAKEAEAIFPLIGLDDGRPLKYLSLPGADMLDVRELHKLCSRRNLLLKYLGFKTGCESTEYDLNISVNEVSKLSHIHKGSEMVVDDIRSVGLDNSKGRNSFEKGCPFDVINFDICDCILEKGATANSSKATYFDALYSMLNIQMNNTTKPWLLFITTRSTPEDVGSETAKLWECVLDNTKKHGKFKSALEEFLGVKISANHSYEDISRLSPLMFTGLFGIGLGKWFLKLMMSEKPICSVKLLTSYRFSTLRSGAPNMLSAAFLFEPIPSCKADNYGIAKQQLKLTLPPTEEDAACSVVESAKNISDLDSIMKKSDLLKIMCDETKSLLADAHYNIDGYDDWLAKNIVKI